MKADMDDERVKPLTRSPPKKQRLAPAHGFAREGGGPGETAIARWGHRAYRVAPPRRRGAD